LLADLWSDCVPGADDRPSLLEKFSGKCSLQGWLATVATNRWIDLKRRHSRRVEISSASSGEGEEDAFERLPADVAAYQEDTLVELLRESLRAAFAHCPAEAMVLLRLVYLHGVTQREVVRMLGWSEAKVSRLLSRAMEQIEDLDVRLLVQGKFASTDLERALRGKLASPRIIRREFLEEREFWRYASATDLCLNLRFPSAAETSGIAISMMGIGKPVLMSAAAETSRFPEAACLRVDTGPGEEELLAEYMVWLAKFPGDAVAIGERAAAHIREFHSAERVARLYWGVLRSCW